MRDTRAGETAKVIRVKATGLPEPFRKPWQERRRITTSVCDRLVNDLDRSLNALRELCSSLNFALPGETGETTKKSS